MSKRIEQPGSYDVTIRGPRFELAEKDGDQTRMTLVLPGFTSDDQTIDGYQYFTRQIISGGRNKGRPMWEVGAELCHDLGMTKPFSPSKLDELDGVVCVFVVEIEEYEGKKRPKVKFINPRRKPVLSADDATRIWDELSGAAGHSKQTAAAASAPQAVEELPF